MKKLMALSFVAILSGVAIWKWERVTGSGMGDQQIVIPLDREIKTLDPAIGFDDDTLTVLGQALDTLYQYHYLKRPYEVIPGLAEALPEITNKGKTYTIKLRKDVRYHDHPAFQGKIRMLKAEDFIIPIKRMAFAPLQSVGNWVFQGKLVGYDSFTKVVGDDLQKMLETNMEGVKALDEHTIELNLVRPEPNLLYFLSMHFTSPVPREIVEHTKNDLSKTLVGTGAYYLTSETQGEFHFEKFKHFYSEKYPSSGDRYANTQKLLLSSTERLPFIHKVILKPIPDEDQRWQMFLDGKIDILAVPSKYVGQIIDPESEESKMLQDKDIATKHFAKLATRWVGFNMQNPPWGKGPKSHLLRAAIAHAIDYDAYNRALSNNSNMKANSIFNPSIPGYDPSHHNSFDFNLEKAKSLLKEAGHPGGEGLPELQFVTRGTREFNLNEANFIKKQIERIGIRVKIKQVEFADFLRLGRTGQLRDIWVDNWIYDYPDAENILQLLISKNSPGVNKSQFKVPEIDDLYNQLGNTLEEDKRFAIMYEIEDIVYKELPWIMLTYESSYFLHSNRIKNFRKSYFIKNYVKYLKKN